MGSSPPKFWEYIVPRSLYFTMFPDRIGFMIPPRILSDIHLPKGYLLAIELNPDTGYCELDVFRDEDAEFVGEKKACHPETYSRFHAIADLYCEEFVRGLKND